MSECILVDGVFCSAIRTNLFVQFSFNVVAKKQYTKRKAVYLNKCVQIGETPFPGLLTGEDDVQTDDFGGSGSYSNQPGTSDSAVGGYGQETRNSAILTKKCTYRKTSVSRPRSNLFSISF